MGIEDRWPGLNRLGLDDEASEELGRGSRSMAADPRESPIKKTCTAPGQLARSQTGEVRKDSMSTARVRLVGSCLEQ